MNFHEFPIKNGTFHCYVGLPEGILEAFLTNPTETSRRTNTALALVLGCPSDNTRSFLDFANLWQHQCHRREIFRAGVLLVDELKISVASG